MTELYKADEQQESFQNEVYRSLDRKAQIAEFKKSNPMYQLLSSKTERGAIPLPDAGLVATFFEALRLGLIDENADITKDGRAWLDAPFEL